MGLIQSWGSINSSKAYQAMKLYYWKQLKSEMDGIQNMKFPL